MRCGEKCFIVTIEQAGEQQRIELSARTSIEARKKLRRSYGEEARIIKLEQDK